MATIRLRNKTYRAEVYCLGVRRSASFRDIDAARQWINAQEKELAPWRTSDPKQPHQITAERPEFQDRLLDPAAILALPRFKTTCGVYFLILDGRIVYVGQSVDIHSRVQKHFFKQFDSYTYIPCQESQLLELERYYIKTLKPDYNVAGVPAEIAA